LYVAQWVKQPRGAADGVVQLVFGDRSRLARFAPHMYTPEANQLFRNDGDGTFSDITDEAGVADRTGRGLGVALADFDGDSRPDLFVANDESPNRFFRNLGGGRFEDASTSARMYDARAGMGVAVADLDGNAALDLVYTNFRTEYNAAVVNRLADGFFSERTQELGLAAGSLGVTSWGVAAEDLDNDGDVDLAMVNGHPTPFDPKVTPFRGDLGSRERCLPERPRVYERNDGTYRNVTAQTGAPAAVEDVGRGLAAGDVDRDGRLDLVATTNQGPSYLWRNVSEPSGHWLTVRLRGGPENRLGVGAVVTVGAPGHEQRRVILSGGSYLSQPPLEAHFGLGETEQVPVVQVLWPNGAETLVENVDADQILVIERDGAAS
ncbi:MAG: CRTAC1 family protein, partial [Myxococcota bacterium]